MVSIPKHRKLLLLYFRYKDSPLYLGSFIAITIVVGILLLWAVVLPQLESFFVLNNEINSTRGRITNLKNNITYLSSLNDAEVDDDLQLTFAALPSEKDFAAIIDAVNTASYYSGVTVNDYNIVIGDLATPSATLKQYGTVDLLLTVSGDRGQSKAFLEKMYQILPLSQVQAFSLTENSSTLKLSFFFKPFPKGSYTVTEPIKEIPEQNAALLNNLSSWDVDHPLSEESVPTNLPPDAAIGSPL